MEIKIVAVGKRMPAWVDTAFSEYHKRLPQNFKLTLVTLNTEKRGKHKSIKQILSQEAEKIKNHQNSKDYLIALDENGKQWSTMELSTRLNHWHDQSQNICFLIGGPDGLAEECKNKADALWSLGKLILPHPLVRIILIEQIYRAISIIQKHPYHRD